MLAGLLSERDTAEFDELRMRADGDASQGVAVQFYTTGCSLRETQAIRCLIGIERIHQNSALNTPAAWERARSTDILEINALVGPLGGFFAPMAGESLIRLDIRTPSILGIVKPSQTTISEVPVRIDRNIMLHI